MKRYLFLLALLVLLQSTSGCSHAVVPVVTVDTAPLVLPDNVGPIIVLVDHLQRTDNFVEERAQQVAIALRNFSADTSWGYVDSAPIEKVASAAAVVFLGLNGNYQPSLAALARLRRAHHLIVSGYHLASLREAGIAFKHTEGGEDVATPPNTTVSFKGQTFPVALHDFLAFNVRAPAVVMSNYNVSLPDRSNVPYIVQDGDALFVNGDISFDSNDVTRRGAMLAVCDAITRFIGARPLPARPLAMLRLEDVSAATPAWRLESFVHYLARAHVPYGIGVIPELRVQGRVIGSLRDQHELLKTLRWAEGHGATIILHGLHHCCSSEDAEGYEFWDHDHNAPVPYDSPEWMHSQVAKGLADLNALGLHPQMWETPHYSASAVDYKVVSQLFGAAWELRRPIGWLPWALKRDQYGVMLLPEDLGYVSLDGTKTVADQLARAKELLVCQSCIAAGFLHPSTVPIGVLRQYVSGLQDLGYAFVDPAQAVHQYSTLKTRREISSASR
jgi:Uncharacterized protein conserved in bacteria (DUF2334)